MMMSHKGLNGTGGKGGSVAGRMTLLIVLALAVSAVAVTPAAAQPDVPLPFAVCVTTVDAGPRFDSYWMTSQEAATRRAEILRDGWTVEGEEIDEEDQYPPHSIVKATTDASADASVCSAAAGQSGGGVGGLPVLR